MSSALQLYLTNRTKNSAFISPVTQKELNMNYVGIVFLNEVPYNAEKLSDRA